MSRNGKSRIKSGKERKPAKSAPTEKRGIQSFITVLSYIIGTAVFLSFTAYIFRQFIFPEGKLSFIMVCLISVCAALPLIIYPGIRKKKPRLACVLMDTYFFVCILFTVTFLVHLSDTLFDPPAVEPENVPDDAVLLVFGSKIQGANPARPLMLRLNKAAEIMKMKPGVLCVVSGGQGKDELYTEASVMRNYLVSAGISPERLIVEEESHDTIENIRNFTDIRSADASPVAGRPVVFVSNGFHLARILTIARRLGINDAYAVASESLNLPTMFFSLLREYCSRAKVLFRIASGRL